MGDYENNMDQATHTKIVSFVCGIAGDVSRDLKSRGSKQQPRQDFENDLDAKTWAVEKEAEGLPDDLLKGVPA